MSWAPQRQDDGTWRLVATRHVDVPENTRFFPREPRVVLQHRGVEATNPVADDRQDMDDGVAAQRAARARGEALHAAFPIEEPGAAPAHDADGGWAPDGSDVFHATRAALAGVQSRFAQKEDIDPESRSTRVPQDRASTLRGADASSFADRPAPLAPSTNARPDAWGAAPPRGLDRDARAKPDTRQQSAALEAFHGVSGRAAPDRPNDGDDAPAARGSGGVGGGDATFADRRASEAEMNRGADHAGSFFHAPQEMWAALRGEIAEAKFGGVGEPLPAFVSAASTSAASVLVRGSSADGPGADAALAPPRMRDAESLEGVQLRGGGGDGRRAELGAPLQAPHALATFMAARVASGLGGGGGDEVAARDTMFPETHGALAVQVAAIERFGREVGNVSSQRGHFDADAPIRRGDDAVAETADSSLAPPTTAWAGAGATTFASAPTSLSASVDFGREDLPTMGGGSLPE